MKYLSICALHKWESVHLREWLEYHLEAGVEHFFLLDNNEKYDPVSTDLLEPYIEKGLVTNRLVYREDSRFQCKVYKEVIDSQPDTEWLAFIDIDEFIEPVQKQTIPEVLTEFDQPDIAGLAMSWRIWGTSGCVEAPEFVIEKNIQRSKNEAGVNRHIKTIVRPSRVIYAREPHSFAPKPGFRVVNERGDTVDGPFMDHCCDKILCNHFVLRSKEDFRWKQIRGRAGSSQPCNDEFFKAHDMNDVEDTDLRDKCIEKVKARCRPQSDETSTHL